MKNEKATDNDINNIELVKAGDGANFGTLLATSSLSIWPKIPSYHLEGIGNRSVTQESDKEDLKNYPPICMLTPIYKLFTRIITNNLTTHRSEQQLRDGAEFFEESTALWIMFSL